MTAPRFVLSGITIDCRDPEVLARFWTALLGGELTVPLPGWLRIASPGSSAPVVNFQPVPEPKQGKARLHLDLTVDDIDGAVRAVTQLGGRSLDQRYEYDEGTVVVMADPEGNEFCLVEYAAVTADS